MPSHGSSTRSMVAMTLAMFAVVSHPIRVAAEDQVGVKAEVTDAVCSNGLTLSDYTIECVDESGTPADCGFGRNANINANVYLDSNIDEGDEGTYVAVMVEGCLGHNCEAVVDAQHIELCGDGEGEVGGEGEDKQAQEYSPTTYSFASTGGQECGQAGSYALSVNNFKLDTFGISSHTWGYGHKHIPLLLTLSGSDKGKSQNSQDQQDDEEGDEGYYSTYGNCEVTHKTGRNPPELIIVSFLTAAICGIVIFLGYKKEIHKAASDSTCLWRQPFDLKAELIEESDNESTSRTYSPSMA